MSEAHDLIFAFAIERKKPPHVEVRYVVAREEVPQWWLVVRMGLN